MDLSTWALVFSRVPSNHFSSRMSIPLYEHDSSAVHIFEIMFIDAASMIRM